MSRRPRFEVIGCYLEGPGPVERELYRRVDRFVGVENYTGATTGFIRVEDVYLALEIVAARHLELPGAHEAQPFVTRGFNCALHCFLEDWEIDDDPGGSDFVIAKQKRNPRVWWFAPYSRGLILGLLSEHWDDVARLCSWPWAGLAPQHSGINVELEDEVALMYIIISSAFRKEPLRGLEKLCAKVRKCRTKRPRLLISLWDAFVEGDQAAFDKALEQSLRHHASGLRLSNRDWRLAERLALVQTAICTAAVRRGMQLPDLPEELSAYLITRRSIGIDD